MLEVVALAVQVAAVLAQIAPEAVTAGVILRTVTIKPQIGVVEVRQITLVTQAL